MLGGCNIGSHKGYEPVQPIAFSHKVHVGDYKVECLYCHYAAERSRYAGVPAASLCMNCHSQVKRDSPNVQTIEAAIEAGTPIAWVRVHRFPDHAFFDHARHVRDGGLQCQRCHGPVETMERTRRAESLGMGFCIDCHREMADRPTNASTPTTDCSACHH